MQQKSILGFLENNRPPQSEGSRSNRPYHSRPYSDCVDRSSHRPNNHRRRPDNRRNMLLKHVADETKEQLPIILADILALDASESTRQDLRDLPPLDPSQCPGFTLPNADEKARQKGTRIQVFDMDTFDAALLLDPEYKVHSHLGLPQPQTKPADGDVSLKDVAHLNDTSNKDSGNPLLAGLQEVETKDKDTMTSITPTSQPLRPSKPVAVLNLASERFPGGGWQNGALAQEECLCYRSSLYLSLHKSYYPLPSLSTVYSPSVVLIRGAMSRGHNLLYPTEPAVTLPVTSVISVAALRKPELTDDRKSFQNPGMRSEMKRKIRGVLRVAALQGHTKLVLGALGCGVFANPPEEVARCFLEVMRETEFQGGWWEEVVFAVLDNIKGGEGGRDGRGNFGVFYRELNGKAV